MEELRRLFPRIQCKLIVPAEVFVAEIECGEQEAGHTIAENLPVFLRHIHPVQAEVETSGREEDAEFIAKAVLNVPNVNKEMLTGAKIAVQIRKPDGLESACSLQEIRQAIEQAFQDRFGCSFVRSDADWIVSGFIGADRAWLGISRPETNLSDWPGGAVRFQREEGQISRAKFKLLEAERVFGLDFSKYRHALDIGAAPGGWTSLLLERGLHVTAVDPAALDPGLLADKKLTFLQRNADSVTFDVETFDLLVCDMSWSPRKMAMLVSSLLYSVRRGGTVIITLKLMHGKAFQAIKETVQSFQTHLTLCRAKQLFHNREELTLYFTKNG
jgi:23S rRNA (cytidine2498-2'-O)-methyltransferase